MTTTMTEDPLWAIVELMGHVRLAGRLTEEEKFGSKLGRLDIPQADGRFVTQWFGGASVYRITATTELIARQLALQGAMAPVGRWELAPPPALSHDPHQDDALPVDEDEDNHPY